MNPRLGRALTGLAGAAALVAGITVLSRLLGFGRWLVQSYAVGSTATGTAYATANQLPNVLFEVVAGGALAGAVIPLLAGPLARGLRSDVDRIASALLTWAVAVLLPAAVLLALLSRPVVRLLLGTDACGGVDGGAGEAAAVDLAARLLVVFAPQVVLYGIGVVLTGVLQAQRRFAWAAAAPLASTLVVIASYLVFRAVAGDVVQDPAALSPAAVAWLGWGTTAGVAAMSLPLLVPVLRSGVRLRPTLTFPTGVAGRARNLALAGIGGLLAQQVAVLVTLRLANGGCGADGTINVFQYSQAVYLLPYAVLVVPLATTAFTRLAEHASTGRHEEYARLVSVTTRAVVVVSAAGAAALAASAPAVTALFVTVDASDDPAGVAAMEPTLVLLAPGLLGFALLFHLSRVLFALERGRAAVTGVAAGWLTVAVASVVAVGLLAPAGAGSAARLAGLALGNTVGMLVGAGVLLAATARAGGRTAVSGLGRTVAVTVAGGVLGALLGRLLLDLLLLDLLAVPLGVVILAGVTSAVPAVLLVVGAAWLLDRGTVRALLRTARGSSAPGTSAPGGSAPGTSVPGDPDPGRSAAALPPTTEGTTRD